MKHTEEQITKKAKQVLQDLDGKYYFEDCIDGVLFKESQKLDYGELKGETIPCWTVYVKAIFDNIDLLFISEETGEPLYYHNFNMILFDVKKDKEGKYYKVE